MQAWIAIVAALCAPPGPHGVGNQFARDALLATPAPHPPNRTDNPARAESGRLWHARWPVGTRSPIVEGASANPGAAAYGASCDDADRLLYARVGHTPIAIDPWTRINGRGAFEDLERARNRWLRENGYVLKVRTHVNPAFARGSEGCGRENCCAGDDGCCAAATGAPSNQPPPPRAIIDMSGEGPRRTNRTRVDAFPVVPRVLEPSGPLAPTPRDQTLTAEAGAGSVE